MNQIEILLGTLIEWRKSDRVHYYLSNFVHVFYSVSVEEDFDAVL